MLPKSSYTSNRSYNVELRSKFCYRRNWCDRYDIFVTADEIATKIVCSTHNNEASGSRINNKIIGLRNSSDQPCNQSDRFDVRMNLAIDLLDPSIGNPVISPGTFCGEW